MAITGLAEDAGVAGHNAVAGVAVHRIVANAAEKAGQ